MLEMNTFLYHIIPEHDIRAHRKASIYCHSVSSSPLWFRFYSCLKKILTLNENKKPKHKFSKAKCLPEEGHGIYEMIH